MSQVSVLECFCAVAGRTPEGIAMAIPDRRVTYQELEAASNRLAHHLVSRGCAKGSLVAVLASDTVEIVTALLGIWKAGGVYIPLEPTLPLPRLQALWSQAPAGWVLAEPAFLDVARELAVSAPDGATIVCVDEAARLGESGRIFVPVGADDLSYIFFTSGSTGVPKGIAGRRKGVDHFIQWESELLGAFEGIRVSQLTSPSFDAFLRDVFLPLTNGGTMCLPTSREVLFDGGQLLGWLDEMAVQVIHCVPTVFRLLLGQGLSPGSLPHLQNVLLSGEALLPGDVKGWLAAFGERVRLINLYGPSETTMTKLFHVVEAGDAQRRIVPIGKPMPGAKALVVDEMNRLCPPEKVGEILLRTPYMSLGYYRQPELTQAVFVPNPFGNDPNDLVYRTGDLGRMLPAGDFEFLGRRDLQVKIRGVRVELGEIESLLRGQPGVTDAAVVARPGPDGNQILCAFVASPRDLAVDTLRAALLEQLPESMVPSTFAVVDDLPRTLSGKVDRSALARRAPETRPSAADGGKPTAPVEELLSQIWMEVLGIRQVGLHDNFFAIGGHSVLAAQVMARVRSAFAVEVPLRAFFEAQTLVALARRIEEAMRGGMTPPPPITRLSREEPLPLSFAQERLWFLDQLLPGSSAYNLSETLQINGVLDLGALARAFAEIVRRHEVLRTSFASAAGQPVQVIAAAMPVPIPVLDLGALPRQMGESAAAQIGPALAGRPFDLEQAPLLRPALLRLACEKHLLLITMHHIVSDAGSVDLLVGELASLYRAFRAGEPSPLPELSVHYADYAAWQRRWLRDEVLEEQLAYWRQQLAGAPPSLELPTDRLRPAVPSGRSGHLLWSLPATVCEGLRQLGRQHDGTLFMGLLAVWSTLLFRLTGQSDVCIGTPISGRDHMETEKLIGFFVNMLVLRVRLTADASFQQAFVHAREVALSAYGHRDLPFSRLVEALQPQRNLQLTPFFQGVLVLHRASRQSVGVSELALESAGMPDQTARFDLTLRATESDDGFIASFEYAADLFDAPTLLRWALHFGTLLRGALAEPERSLAELPLLSEAQRHQLLAEWNDTGRTDIPSVCMHELIAAQAAATPDALAVVCEDRQLTYAELDRLANQLAHRLRRLGVRLETVAGILIEPSIEMVVAMLAVHKAGGGYLGLDLAFPGERLAFLLADAHVPLVVTRESLAGRLAGLGVEVVRIDADGEGLGAESETAPVSGATPDHLAYVIYTSGSTGQPKGVVGQHAQLLAYLQGILERLGPPAGASFALQQSLAVDAPITYLFASLCYGGVLHLVTPERLGDPEALADLFGRRPVDYLKIAPSHIAALMASGHGRRILPRRLLLVGGEASSWDRVRILHAEAPHCTFLNHYGPTETTVGVLTYRADDVPSNPPSNTLPLGRPLAGARVYVLDARSEPLPIGVTGELYIGGGSLARGYLGRPDLTAARFVPDPFAGRPGSRLYRTGDLARALPDSTIEFLGRVDHQVKVRGFRVELEEVEIALTQHPGVVAAVVLAWRDAAETNRLIGYVVPAGEPAPTTTELRRFLGEKLPEHMVPSAFVFLERLPRTPQGKVDRRALPAPEGARPELEERFAAPHTPVEEVLTGIWAELLGLERVGAADHFFDLGGHSLLATRMVAAVRAACEVEISVRDLFEAPTPGALALRVEQARRNGRGLKLPPIVPVPRDRELPLSLDQRRLWFLDQLEPGNPFYNRCDAVLCRGPLDLTVLAQCFEELVRRHEILRTVFPEVGGQPVQVVTPPAPLPLPRIDLEGLASDRREGETRRLIAAELRVPFDLARGPLLRVRVFRLSPEEHVIGLCMHHIIWDGGSTPVLVRDLVALYRAFAAGKPSPLAPLPVQYADFACWQQEHFQGELLEEQLAYWRQQLAGIPPRLELITDRPRPLIQSFRGSDVPIDLPADLVAQLRVFSRRRSATLFMTLLAAFDVLLSARSGSPDIVVSVPAGNRGRPELEPLVGFFVNMLALRTRLTGETHFADLVEQVRKTSLDALDHMHVPFDRVVNTLRLPRDLAYNTLTQVSFVLGSAPSQGDEVPDLVWTRMEVDKGTVQYELNLSLGEVGGGLSGVLEYSTELFDRSTAVRMAKGFELILRTVVERPDVPVQELEEMLAEGARQDLVATGLRQLQRARRRSAVMPAAD